MASKILLSSYRHKILSQSNLNLVPIEFLFERKGIVFRRNAR